MTELKYTKNGDYLFPEMGLSETDRTPVGKYGLMRQQYLEQNRKALYSRLLLSGKLMEHLHETERTAKARMNEMMALLTAQNGVTEQLKAQNQMLWVAKMNSLQHQAEETILSELIYA
ncbi:MAG: TnpV protein [Clostridiales bacterium]|nr:TnpV protein [Clostridiales bacterium]